MTWIEGDSIELDTLTGDAQLDFIFSCPPYYDLEVYGESQLDLSRAESYDAFLRKYGAIVSKAVGQLRDDRFACFVVGDIRDKDGFYRNFVSDTITVFQDAGMTLYNEAILINVLGSLPIRVAKAFVSGRKLGKCHQNVLVFYKGNPKHIREQFPTLVVEDLTEKMEQDDGAKE